MKSIRFFLEYAMQEIFRNTLSALRKLLQKQLLSHLPGTNLEKPSAVKVDWFDSLSDYKNAWNNLLKDQNLSVNKNDNVTLRASKTAWNFCVGVLSIVETAKNIPVGSGPLDTTERTAKEALIAKRCIDLQDSWGDFNPEQKKMKEGDQYLYPKITNEISLELARIIQGLCRALNEFVKQENFSFVSPEIDAVLKKDSQGMYDQVVDQLKNNLIGDKVTVAICRYLYVAPMFEIANELEELYKKSLGKINRIAKQTIEALRDLQKEIECGVKDYSSKDKSFQQKLLEEYSPIPEDFDIFKARREVFAGQEGVKDVLLKLSDQLVVVVHEISERVASQNVPQVLENPDSPTPTLKIEVSEHSNENPNFKINEIEQEDSNTREATDSLPVLQDANAPSLSEEKVVSNSSNTPQSSLEIESSNESLDPVTNENEIESIEDSKASVVESTDSLSAFQSADIPSASMENAMDLGQGSVKLDCESNLKIHKSEKSLQPYISKYESRSLLFKVRNPDYLNGIFQKLQGSYPDEKERLQEKLNLTKKQIYTEALQVIEANYRQLLPEFFGENESKKGRMERYLSKRKREYEQSWFFSKLNNKDGKKREDYLEKELKPALISFCENRNNLNRQQLINMIDQGIQRFKPRTDDKDSRDYKYTLKYLLEKLKNQINVLSIQENLNEKCFGGTQESQNSISSVV